MRGGVQDLLEELKVMRLGEGEMTPESRSAGSAGTEMEGVVGGDSLGR